MDMLERRVHERDVQLELRSERSELSLIENFEDSCEGEERMNYTIRNAYREMEGLRNQRDRLVMDLAASDTRLRGIVDPVHFVHGVFGSLVGPMPIPLTPAGSWGAPDRVKTLVVTGPTFDAAFALNIPVLVEA